MDIFFCDSCAARVTSADLQRGQGLKKGDVVICQTCIEKGLGGDLLAAAGAVPEPVAVTVDSHSQPDASVGPPDTDTLVRVGEQMLARSEEPADEEPESAPYSADQAMAEAASGFDALNPSEVSRRDDGEDDVEDSADLSDEYDDASLEEDQEDDDPQAVSPAQSDVDEDEDDEEGEDDDEDDDDEYEDEEEYEDDEDEDEQEQVFPDDGRDLPPQGQVETIEIAHADRPAPAPAAASAAPKKKKKRRRKGGGGNKARSGPSQRAASSSERSASRRSSGRHAAAGPSSSARGSANKSGRAAAVGSKSGRPSTRRPKLDNTAKVLIGAVSAAGLVFLVVLVMWLGGSRTGGGGQRVITTNPERELIQEVQRVRAIVDAALTRNGTTNNLADLDHTDIPALEQALREIDNPHLQELVDRFEAEATAAGWTEAEGGQASSQYRDLRTRRRTVSDHLGTLRRRHGR